MTERQAESVKALRHADKAMTEVLNRISVLESALSSARSSLETAKTFISKDVYTYAPETSNRISCHDRIDNAIEAATKALGPR